jgi:aryl-alcohol dehydrogenase-like predicted oxidoreductase
MAHPTTLFTPAGRSRLATPSCIYCEKHGIGFIPWFPIASGKLLEPGGPLRSRR